MGVPISGAPRAAPVLGPLAPAPAPAGAPEIGTPRKIRNFTNKWEGCAKNYYFTSKVKEGMSKIGKIRDFSIYFYKYQYFLFWKIPSGQFSPTFKGGGRGDHRLSFDYAAKRVL